MRLLLLLFPIIIFFSPVAFALEEDFTQGKELFLSGNFPEARKHLFAAFKDDPANPQINFFLGRTAFEQGDYETALMAFERVLIMNPEAARVKLEIARCHLRLGFREMAKQYFREVLATNPPAPVWENIERYLLAIKKMDKRHLFTGTFTVGIGWDDNVYLSPVSDLVFGIPLTGPTAKPVDDQIYSTTAILNHVYRFDNPSLTWKNTFTNYNALYENEHVLDVYYFSLTSGPVWKTDSFMWNNHLIAKHIDVEHDRYLDSFGLGTVLTIPAGQKILLSAGGQVEKKENYQDNWRDGTNVMFNFNPILTLGANRISGFFFKEMEDADSQLYSYDRIGWTLRYERKLPRQFAAFASFGVKQTDYDGTNPLFFVQRSDTVQEVRTGISKLLWQSKKNQTNLSGELTYTYLDSDSNISLYTYRKNLVTLSFTVGFF